MWNKKEMSQLDATLTRVPLTLTFHLEFSRSNCISGMGLKGHIWNLLYLNQKWFHCHKTKGKHIYWMLGIKWGHWVWPCPWPWPWIFKVNCGICYISAKNGLLPRNEKQTCQLKFRPQMGPLGLILAMTLTLNYQGQLWNLLYLSQKWSDCHETKANISVEHQASNVTMILKGEVWGSN